MAHGGGRIRVSAQLIDTSTGANRWAERFDRKLEDVFEVQDDVVRMIVAIIAVQLNKAEVERAHIKPPTTWQAYDFYPQGAAAYAARLSTYLPAQLYAARRCFEQSIALVPSLARAHSQLSRTFLSAWINPVDDDHMRHAALDRAYDLARRPNWRFEGTEDFWLIVTPRKVKMRQKSSAPPMRLPAEKLVRDIRRAARKRHCAEDKIRNALEGLGFEEGIENIKKFGLDSLALSVPFPAPVAN